MQVSRIYAVYFSPVGSTGTIIKHLSLHIADHLDVPVFEIDFTLPGSRKTLCEFNSSDLVVIGLPTYAGRIPNKILSALQSIFHGDHTPVIPVVTFGNRGFDSSLAELRNEMEQNGFIPIAAGAFVCQHVFSNAIGEGRPDEKDYDEIESFGKKIVDLLSILNPDQPIAHLDLEEHEDVLPYYTPLTLSGEPARFLKAKPVTDTGLCDHCGLCAKKCPMGSIDPIHTDQIIGICIKCMACIRLCPKKAKAFVDSDWLSHVSMLERNYVKRAENKTYLLE